MEIISGNFNKVEIILVWVLFDLAFISLSIWGHSGPSILVVLDI